MSEYHHSELFEKVIQGLVRHHARKLIRCGVVKPQDKDDLKQALFVRLWISLRAYRSSRGSHGPFLKVVSKHAAVNLLRDQLAQKRNSAGITSLNVNILCGGRWGEFAQVISQRELEARTGRTARSDRERCELKHDVNEVIGQLHPHLQQLAERLKHSTISEVARDLGLPRASVYESVGQIRRRFEKAGLKKYLTPFSVSRLANGVIKSERKSLFPKETMYER